MSVHVNVEWRSSHAVEPPAGMTDEEFEELLADRDEKAWDHALDQVDSGTAELNNWEVGR